MSINMKKIMRLLLSAAACLQLTATVWAAEPEPVWVQKGVKPLNRERTNKSYGFHAFETFGEDVGALQAERFRPLKEHIGEQYGVSAESMQLDSLVWAGSGADDRITYRISFPKGDGQAEVYAQLVDEWSSFSDDINTWGFEFHQLYAVSEHAGAVPEFDSFSVTRDYPAKAALMSIIPGLGQIYKGQSGKGYAIMASEAVLVGGAIYSAVEMAHYNRLSKNDAVYGGSFRSDVTTFRQLRNVCLIAGGALYLYNLIDAAVVKGARRVVVKRPASTDAELTFVPVVTQYGAAGVGLSVRF